MKRIKYWILSTVLIGLSFNLNAQNGSNTVLESIMNAYKGDFNFSFTAKYKYYETLTTKTVADSLDSYTCIHNDEYYFKIADYELVGNEKYSIFADNKSRQLVFGAFSENEKKKRSFNFIESLLKSTGATISEFDPGDGGKGLTLNYKNQQITKADIIYDPKTFWIKKCTLFYLDKIDPKTGQQSFSRLEIIYGGYKKESQELEDDYGLSKFVSIKNSKTYSVMQRFSGYEFINLTPLKRN